MKLLHLSSVLINILLFVTRAVTETVHYNETDTAMDKTGPTASYNSRGEPKILSRRKRFIVFPDGSSFQLVFCTQNQGYIQVGDIIWFGNTAALAWELPSDPKLLHFLKDYHKIDGAQRRNDGKNIHYVDEESALIGTVPYRKKFIVNPAFAKRKRSIDYVEGKSDINAEANLIIDPVAIKEMHKMHKDRNILKCENADECNAEFHRKGRSDLYQHLEKYIDALGWRGRECVLRLLCESAQRQSEQGTFLHEIVRAVFTLPGGHEFAKDSHREYDVAHRATRECSKLYPACQNRHGESLFM